MCTIHNLLAALDITPPPGADLGGGDPGPQPNSQFSGLKFLPPLRTLRYDVAKFRFPPLTQILDPHLVCVNPCHPVTLNDNKFNPVTLARTLKRLQFWTLYVNQNMEKNTHLHQVRIQGKDLAPTLNVNFYCHRFLSPNRNPAPA